MLDNANKRDCGFGAEIVSYIYDELTADGRRRFESHLKDCTACTDEFAEISYARFSVFEWQKNEFATLKTPEIIIPYESRIGVQAESSARGFLAGFGELVGSWRLAFAVVALVFGGLAFLTFTYFRQPGQKVISIVENGQNPASAAADPGANSTQTKDLPQEPEIALNRTAVEEDRTFRPSKARQARAAIRPHSLVNSQNLAKIGGQRVTKQKVTTAPVLTNFDESDDRSLRLADLFDTEVGVR